MKKYIVIFIISVLLIAFFIGRCSDNSLEVAYDEVSDIEQIEAVPIDNDKEIKPGNEEELIKESNAVNPIELPIILRNTPEQLLKRKTYSVSYNQDTKCPNWVAWHLTAEHADGDCPRYSKYDEDMEVPTPRATNADYKGSGWTRGHMCPAGDNKWDADAMKESNLLSNMCPQHASLNSGLWNVIERDCRKWAVKYGDVYIVCGPVFLNKEHETIGINKVVVPEAFFKVILRLNPKPSAIGFVVRNNEGKKKKDQFVNTVDDVERITGMDFFPALPDDIENVVESTANLKDWQ